MNNSFDSFNQVSDKTNLTHANMLTSLAKYQQYPDEISVGIYSYSDPRIGINSMANDIADFYHDPNKKNKSFVVCSGNLVQVDYGRGEIGNELRGDNHWTTLNFHKDNQGKITAYYTDSLNGNSSDASKIPEPITKLIDHINQVMPSRGGSYQNIEVKKLLCESQPDLHKCGDYAVFNALALNQMSDEDFNANKVKDVINLTHRNDSLQRDQDYSGSWVVEYTVNDFCNQNREFLKQNYNSNNSSSNQSSRQKSTPKPSMLCDNLAKNLEESLIIRNSCDHLNEDSMIATAIAISSIEEDNLKFLNQLKDKIIASGINFNPRVDEDSIKLLDLISSPIIASNLEKFLPILTRIEADPNQIHDHKIFGEFENKIFESQGKNKAQYSQETESLDKVKYHLNNLFNPRLDDPLHANTPDQLIDSLKQYAQISQSKIQPQEFDALKNIKDLTPFKPLFEEIIQNPDSLNYSSFSVNLKNEIYKNILEENKIKDDQTSTPNRWASMVRRTSGNPSSRLP
jgi:hypothetical protein